MLKGWLTASVTGGGRGYGCAVETGKTQSHENAQETRGPPTLNCTDC